MQAMIGVRSVRSAVMLLERSVLGPLCTPVQPLALRELKQSLIGFKSVTKLLQVVSSHLPATRLCTLYSVLCALYYALCTLYSVLCTLHYALCTLYFVPPSTDGRAAGPPNIWVQFWAAGSVMQEERLVTWLGRLEELPYRAGQGQCHHDLGRRGLTCTGGL